MKTNKMINRVVYVVEDTNTPQFRYRVKNVIEAFSDDSKWSVEYHLKSDLEKLKLDDVKLLIIVRQTAKDRVVLNLITKAKKLNIVVLFDLDDLIFDYSDLGILMESVHEKNKLYWIGYIWGIRRIARRIDGFICTNEYLAGKLKRSFKKPAKIIPNSLNQKQIETSEKCIIDGKKKHEGFIIGYFSGSPTHAKDFALVEPELLKFLEAYDDAKLRIVGYMNFSNEMKKWIHAGRVEMLEPVDYLKLQGLMAGVDVNIAPLIINDFTNCKSELKFFEAAIVETITIASPTYAFKKAIMDGENGFLAKPNEWYNKLEYLYKRAGDNQKIALMAKKYALNHYYGKEFLKEVEAVYGYFAK